MFLFGWNENGNAAEVPVSSMLFVPIDVDVDVDGYVAARLLLWMDKGASFAGAGAGRRDNERERFGCWSVA